MSGEVRTRAWTRREYGRLIALGVLHEDERIELVAGRLVVREPQRTPHATGVRLADRALRRAFPDTAWQVNVGLPLALDDDSEPEPDVCVTAGGPRDYVSAHPARPVLVVEVSESSLAFDRSEKAGIYARAGLSDYWIVNLAERALEVRRDPTPAPAAPHGWAYRSVLTLRPPAMISPLAMPDAMIAVADLLP